MSQITILFESYFEGMGYMWVEIPILNTRNERYEHFLEVKRQISTITARNIVLIVSRDLLTCKKYSSSFISCTQDWYFHSHVPHIFKTMIQIR